MDRDADSGVRRRTFIFQAVGLGGGTLSQLLQRRPRTAPTAISYAFADEFNGPAGSAPDPSKWEYDTGGGGWGNGELEAYTDSRTNSFQDGQGHLVIRATKSVETSAGRTITTYRSARLKTMGKFSSYGGTFEARIKLDVRPGLWPAWWALGASFGRVGWPACGEVDMLENYGDSTAQTSVHTPDDAGHGVLTKYADTSLDDQWHTWRMGWDTRARSFTFYKDGVKYLTVVSDQMANWCFSSGDPMFMVLNLAVGGAAGTPPETVQFPVDLLVDYVRVWT